MVKTQDLRKGLMEAPYAAQSIGIDILGIAIVAIDFAAIAIVIMVVVSTAIVAIDLQLEVL